MSGFTKGPWFVSKPKGEHRAFVMSDMGKIATVAFNSGKMNVNANANLIAAAQDMYKALVMVAESCESTTLSGCCFASKESVEMILKALAKADGKGE